jgi:hypothetical protein
MALPTSVSGPPSPEMISAGVDALRVWGDPRRLIDNKNAEQAITAIWNAMAKGMLPSISAPNGTTTTSPP